MMTIELRFGVNASALDASKLSWPLSNLISRLSAPQTFDDFEFANLPYRDEVEKLAADGYLTYRHVHSVNPCFAREIRPACSERLFVIFTGVDGGVMGPPHVFLQKTSLITDNVLVLRDTSRRGFRRGIAANLRDLNELAIWIDGYRMALRVRSSDVYCVGVSSGGEAALWCGHLLQARIVWGLAVNQSEPGEELPTADFECRSVLATHNGVTQYRLIYNQRCWPDRKAAQRLSDLPGVQCLPQDGDGHNIMGTLERTGQLEGLFADARRSDTLRASERHSSIAECVTSISGLNSSGEDTVVELDSMKIVELVEALERDFGVYFPIERLSILSNGSLSEVLEAIGAAARTDGERFDKDAVARLDWSINAVVPYLPELPLDRGPLIRRLWCSAQKHSEHPALVIGNDRLTYRDLFSVAHRFATGISLACAPRAAAYGVVVGHRNVATYAAYLGLMAAGLGYVPINSKDPIARILNVIKLVNPQLVVVCADAEELLPSISSSDVGCPAFKFADLVEQDGRIQQNASTTGPKVATDLATHVPSELGQAYVLFTSGSTGTPKGVAIAQSSVVHYVDRATEIFGIGPNDRMSQHASTTFDFSVHDMFVCWSAGAALFVLSDTDLWNPTNFIRKHELTHWASVPSVVAIMGRVGALDPGSLPSLRSTMFSGEALEDVIARAWHIAAPNSEIFNFHGTTEATVAETYYRWVSGADNARNGIVSIGRPFDGIELTIVDEHLALQRTGEPGELCISGPQVASGYWQQTGATQERFVRLPQSGERVWYRTGDRATVDIDGRYWYAGRLDQQIKIRGHRVETAEVEHCLSSITAGARVVVVGWPQTRSGAEGLVAFIEADAQDPETLLRRCKETLPSYMIPQRLIFVGEFRLTENGKIDRISLARQLMVD
jgi:D-alanine--poly(phosphoribitol) ligase subunit 1